MWHDTQLTTTKESKKTKSYLKSSSCYFINFFSSLCTFFWRFRYSSIRKNKRTLSWPINFTVSGQILKTTRQIGGEEIFYLAKPVYNSYIIYIAPLIVYKYTPAQHFFPDSLQRSVLKKLKFRILTLVSSVSSVNQTRTRMYRLLTLSYTGIGSDRVGCEFINFVAQASGITGRNSWQVFSVVALFEHKSV